MALIGEMKYLTIGGNTYSIPVPDLSSKVSKTGDTITGALVVDSAHGGELQFYNINADFSKTITLKALTRKSSYSDDYQGYLFINGSIACSTTPSYDADLTNKSYVDTHALPTGGTAGQFLVKSSATNYDAAWVTVPSANGVSF